MNIHDVFVFSMWRYQLEDGKLAFDTLRPPQPPFKKWMELIYSLKVSFHITNPPPQTKKKTACTPWRSWGALAKRLRRRSAGGGDGPIANARAACGAGRTAEGRGHGIHNVKWWSTAGWIHTLQLSWKKKMNTWIWTIANGKKRCSLKTWFVLWWKY